MEDTRGGLKQQLELCKRNKKYAYQGYTGGSRQLTNIKQDRETIWTQMTISG